MKKSKRYNVNLSIESIIAMKEVMAEYIQEVHALPKKERIWYDDFITTIPKLDKQILKHNKEAGTDGNDSKNERNS